MLCTHQPHIPDNQYFSPRRCEPFSAADLCQNTQANNLAMTLAKSVGKTKGVYRESAVYILHHPGSGHCKIGVAHDPRLRLEGFQIAHWAPIAFTALFWVMDGSATGLEMLAHRVASKIMKKGRGEWVTMEPDEAANLVATVALSSPVKIADSAMWMRNRERVRIARSEWAEGHFGEKALTPQRAQQSAAK